jgi:predicted nucleotidyltransferase
MAAEKTMLVDAIVAALPDVVAVYLFGSEASGETLPDSDLDIAVLTRAPVGPVQRWDLQERLASLVHRDVDLLVLGSASTVMRMQVVQNGRLLFDADPTARGEFEAMVFSDYARLQSERRAIIEDATGRGQIHG